MRALIITNLFPNRVEPGRGLFNQQQLAALPRDWALEVIAPVPWAPRVPLLPVSWRRLAGIPARETVGGLTVHHPRYLVIPKVGRWLSGRTFFRGIWPTLQRAHAAAPFDAILATWAYPDVFGAVLAARRLGLPVVAKVHGSDVHLAARSGWRCRAIRWALERCAGVVAVSAALKDVLVSFGVPEGKIRVIPNGVDIERFRPMDRREARVQLSLPLEGRRIVFVGNLDPVKGLPVLLRAMAALPEDVSLSLVGDGAQRAALDAFIKRLGLTGRATLVGRVPHAAIPSWMNAADLFCLPSVSEGCPNVVIEALACGRPVVASRVGGIPELLQDARCGLLVTPNDPAALADSLRRGLAASWEPAAIRRTVEHRCWGESARRLGAVLAAAVNVKGPEPRAPSPEPSVR